MKTFPRALALAAAATLSQAIPAAAQPTSPPPQLGHWTTESGNLEVEIAPCGEALCGIVTRVLSHRSMSAPGREMNPADKRPALGMKILTSLRPLDDGILTGEIYNRENGKTYCVRLTMDGPQQLLVRPYIGLPLFGKTQLWTRTADRAGAAQ